MSPILVRSTPSVTRQNTRPAGLLLIAALVAVVAMLGLAGSASAATGSGAENRVGATTTATQDLVGAAADITAGQRLGKAAARPEIVVATGVAAKTGPALPKALSGGAADTSVYFGAKNGKNVYAGITNNLGRRQAEHGGRFALDPITAAPVTRGQARSIEQALIVRNPGFQNVRNSISPNHGYYDDAVAWGESWLNQGGF